MQIMDPVRCSSEMFSVSAWSATTPTYVRVVNDFQRHPIFELCDRISPRNRKILRHRFCLFIWGPRQIFKANKKVRKSRDTVPF